MRKQKIMQNQKRQKVGDHKSKVLLKKLESKKGNDLPDKRQEMENAQSLKK